MQFPSFGVGAGPVPADHRRAGMRGQPRLHGCRLPVRQQVHYVPGGDVYQDGPVHVALAQREVVDLSGVRTNFCQVFAGGDVQTASAAWSGGADAVPLEQASEPEKLAVGGGELFLELADRGSPRVAFAAEFLGEDVDDVAAVRVLWPGIRGRTVFLLVPELLDALAEVVVAVEEVNADRGGAGDGP